ncbi:tyrosine-type recombinase/integrase [Gilliamella sp. B3367]|nr:MULTISPECIES: tyrosine-type recombinase/integrase [unclassified Gilliamella]MCX8583515.1 tyrosine-type recombinase/integrase [Gilliamella sp. B3372]MCX8594008.1 tyrosine-type recombinase/integrase [Gilliamella sp. B3367]
MLTIKAIDSAKPKDKPYKLPDFESLYLYITPSGTKSWRYDYQFNGKRKTLTIGKYPYISLSEARNEKELARQLLAHGKDPSFERKKSALLANVESDNTFKSIASEWHSSKKSTWSKKYANEIISIFERDIFPYIGNEPISKIKPLEMLTVLKAIESRGALEIAKKARMRCGEVFRYAIITGRAEVNPTAELSSAMAKTQSKNFPFLATDAEMSEFLKSLKGYSGNILTRYATMLLIYTVPRTIELLTLKWSNINFKQKLATIDEEVVKKDRVHLIPLATQAIEILKFLQPITGHGEFVFPNRNHPSKPMSNGAILHVIRRLGYANRASGHGFRHQFSSVLNEHGFNRDWIEKQLNHEEGSVRGIYNHAQYLEGRREMMQWYADYIDGLTA